MAWFVAPALQTQLAQINAFAPGRSKASDGSIGDPSHSARGSGSDHNPDDDEMVCARDYTHDPAGGFDAHAFARRIAAEQDRRLKYVISEDRICSGPGGPLPGVWRPYQPGNPGRNQHRKHSHVSTMPGALGRQVHPWAGVTPVLAGATLIEALEASMSLDDKIESRNPDSRGKTITVREVLQDIQANCATAARDADAVARHLGLKK